MPKYNTETATIYYINNNNKFSIISNRLLEILKKTDEIIKHNEISIDNKKEIKEKLTLLIKNKIGICLSENYFRNENIEIKEIKRMLNKLKSFIGIKNEKSNTNNINNLNKKLFEISKILNLKHSYEIDGQDKTKELNDLIKEIILKIINIKIIVKTN